MRCCATTKAADAIPRAGPTSDRATTSRDRGVFLDLFYGLREEGVPVAIQEWQAFLTALDQGLHGSSLLRFYHLGRACLVKSETYFDAYDRVFARVFRGGEGAPGAGGMDERPARRREPRE